MRAALRRAKQHRWAQSSACTRDFVRHQASCDRMEARDLHRRSGRWFDDRFNVVWDRVPSRRRAVGWFMPLPGQERMISKSAGKLRRLVTATTRDLTGQAALKLVPEPILGADFHPYPTGSAQALGT